MLKMKGGIIRELPATTATCYPAKFKLGNCKDKGLNIFMVYIHIYTYLGSKQLNSG